MEHPIQFLRRELLDLWGRLQKHGTNEERLRLDIDLSCENIIEQFELENYEQKS